MPLQKRVHELKGRRLDAKASVPKAHLGTAKLTKKMFVGGTGELTDTDFREHFSQYGEIEDAAVSAAKFFAQASLLGLAAVSTAGSAKAAGPRVHKLVQGCAAVQLVRKVAEGCGGTVGALAAGLPGQGLTRLSPGQHTGVCWR